MFLRACFIYLNSAFCVSFKTIRPTIIIHLLFGSYIKYALTLLGFISNKPFPKSLIFLYCVPTFSNVLIASAILTLLSTDKANNCSSASSVNSAVNCLLSLSVISIIWISYLFKGDIINIYNSKWLYDISIVSLATINVVRQYFLWYNSVVNGF